MRRIGHLRGTKQGTEGAGPGRRGGEIRAAGTLTFAMRKPTSPTARETRIATLAQVEHGVLATAELLACGLTYAGITRRLQAGRLHRLYYGVYAVGHTALSREGQWLAAVKACGPHAVLSHHSAAELWGLIPRSAGPTHVMVPHARKRHANCAISLHRSRTLTRADVIHLDRIPVTTRSRTLRDLKRVLPREQLEAALDRARSRGFDVSDVVDEEPTRSVLERRFLRLCRRHRVPAPRVNVLVGTYVVDFLWPESRLVVEVDGYEFHRGRASFEADRARDSELTRQGYRVVRFTYRQVTKEPFRVAAEVRELLRFAA
jgi:very-short-patch-repair endonuclease